MAKILVTGGAGFIGTHLCRALAGKGHEVRVLDLVAPEIAIPGVRYEQGDVRIAADVVRLIDGVAAVYHFAALVSVPLCQEQPLEGYRSNLLATCEVLEAIRRESDKQGRKVRLIFSGSSVVYGNLAREHEPSAESGPTAPPMSFYGAQKLGSEHAIALFHRTHGVPAVLFRFFNVYGPGQDPRSPYSGVISIFAAAVKEGRALQLNADGRPTRDFISVHDVVAANLAALELPEAQCDARPINLGTGRSVTIRQLAQQLVLLGKSKSELRNAPPREGDVQHSMAAIDRAEKVLGWAPRIALAAGLAELMESA